MANIEMYGVEKSGIISLTIGEKMREMGLGEDVVVTTIDGSYVHSCTEESAPAPFLRVYATSVDEIKEIVEALKEMEMGMDVETLLLTDFIPARMMK